MKGFVRTDTILDKILTHTAQDLEEKRARISLSEVRRMAAGVPPARDLVAALRGDSVSLIAEVKHASPSRGVLIDPFDPVAIGMTYAANGASAVSVLTDERFFQGHLDYLTSVREAIDLPALRKDFTIDAYQLYEARAAGADAILLIVATLDDDQLADLHALTGELGMAALVEVHDEAELERAMRIGPRLLGVNNRDLKTFEVDLRTTERLIAEVSDEVVFVAESGILSGDDVRRMGDLGADAALVGEALVKAGDIGQAVREFSGQPKKARSGRTSTP